MKIRSVAILIALFLPITAGCSWNRNLNKLLGMEKKVAVAETAIAKNGAAQAVAKDVQMERVRENNTAIRKSLEAPNLDESSPYWSWCHIAYQLAEANESAIGSPKEPLDISKEGFSVQEQVAKTRAATAKFEVEVAKGRELQDKLDTAEKKQRETESTLAKAQASLKDLWLSIKLTFLGLGALLVAYMAFRVYLALNPATAGVSLGLSAARGAFKELVSGIEGIKETVFSHPAVVAASPEEKQSLELQIKNILLKNSSTTSDAVDKLTKNSLS